MAVYRNQAIERAKSNYLANLNQLIDTASRSPSDFLLREGHSLLCKFTTRETRTAQDGFANLIWL